MQLITELLSSLSRAIIAQIYRWPILDRIYPILVKYTFQSAADRKKCRCIIRHCKFVRWTKLKGKKIGRVQCKFCKRVYCSINSVEIIRIKDCTLAEMRRWKRAAKKNPPPKEWFDEDITGLI